eukprot:3188984-Rhodomonas_salina.1
MYLEATASALQKLSTPSTKNSSAAPTQYHAIQRTVAFVPRKLHRQYSALKRRLFWGSGCTAPATRCAGVSGATIECATWPHHTPSQYRSSRRGRDNLATPVLRIAHAPKSNTKMAWS